MMSSVQTPGWPVKGGYSPIGKREEMYGTSTPTHPEYFKLSLTSYTRSTSLSPIFLSAEKFPSRKSYVALDSSEGWSEFLIRVVIYAVLIFSLIALFYFTSDISIHSSFLPKYLRVREL
jgi:hypothetical protein